MPQNGTWSEFSAGWTPSDDRINGRKNGLLKMENVELDKNGALTLCGGTSAQVTLPDGPDVLFATQDGLSGLMNIYSGIVNGDVYRNSTKIVSIGGGSFRVSFGTAFNYTLITSANKRLKDKGDGSALLNLGVGASTVAPKFPSLAGVWKTPSIIPTGGGGVNYYTISGTWAAVSPTTLNFSPPGFTGGLSVSTYQADLTASVDQTILHPFLSSNLAAAINQNANATADDVFTLRLNCPAANNFVLVSVIIQIFASQPSIGAPSLAPSDFFTGTWNNAPETGNALNYIIQFKRSDFVKTGSNSVGWDTVWGYRISVTVAPLPNGTAALPTCSIIFDQYPSFSGGDQALGGDNYEYAQVNVRTEPSYIAKSPLGPISTVVSIPTANYSQVFFNPLLTYIENNSYFSAVQIQNPAPYDSQCTETWLFRRGGNLDQWYRVSIIPVSVFAGASSLLWWDFLSDENALTLGITANLNLISLAAVTDPILDIIGPIEGRWFYFTATMMYPSDINDPDLVDTSLAVKTIGSQANEIYRWARKVGEAAIMVGTTRDIYVLTGTFQTLPDNTIDVYYRPTSCPYPPRTSSAVHYNNQIFYFAADGWRSISVLNNQTENLTVPNTDRLYNQIDSNGNPHISYFGVGTQNGLDFPCTVAKNKLWTVVQTVDNSNVSGTRMEVYDFARNYWKVLSFGTLTPNLLYTLPDGDVICSFSDKKIRILDIQQPSLLIDGVTKRAVTILSPVFDGGASRNRKDFYTLKARIMTGGDPLTVAMITEDGTSYTIGTISSNASQPTEQYLDIPFNQPLIAAPHKTWQWSLTGNFGVFTLDDIGLDFDLRPTPLTYLRIPPNNYGNASKKRVRVLPFVIDTLGNNVTFTPVVDGVALPGTVITTTDKTTVRTFIKTDIFGVDYGGKFSGGLFEYYEQVNPDIVQTLPIARQFDQVGPQELFRYGKVKQLELRVLPFGTTIPFKIYFNDSSNLVGSLTVVSGVEASYFIGVPKGTSGNIVRLELGPTSFDFHRYYIRLQVAVSGKDTENEWVTLGAVNG